MFQEAMLELMYRGKKNKSKPTIIGMSSNFSKSKHLNWNGCQESFTIYWRILTGLNSSWMILKKV